MVVGVIAAFIKHMYSGGSCWDFLEPRCPTFDTASPNFWVVAALVALLIFFDVGYFTRIWCDRFMTRLRRKASPPPILSTHVYRGTFLTTTLDFSHNVNNATGFLRECHFAQQAYLHSSYVHKAAKKLGVNIFNSSNNVKLRKPIAFFQSYSIHTRIVWWDEQSLYVEQKLVRSVDHAVCAINFSRQTVIGCSPQALLDQLPVCTCKPDVPPEIASWMVCIKVVNKELHLNGCC